MSALIALQKKVFETLGADATLTGLIGPGKMFDDVSPGIRPPYLVLTSASAADWSTGTEDGAEIRFEIDAWSPERGRKAVALIADAAIVAIEQIASIEAPWRLINLRHVSTSYDRDTQTEYHHVRMSFRAVVEPI
jgi:hypothetical protein